MTFNCYFPAMQYCILPDKMKSDTTARLFLLPISHLIKTVKDIRQFSFRYPDTRIRYAYHCILSAFFPFPGKRQGDFSVFWGKLKCVGKKIINNLMYFIPIKYI